MFVEERKIVCTSSCGKHALVGILSTPDIATASLKNGMQPVIILLHGAMAHKNSFYHKDLSASLADKFNCHVYRYDQVGSGESLDGGAGPSAAADTEGYRECGPRNMMNGFHRDVEDLRVVVHVLAQQHKLFVAGIIGHSRGGLLAHLFAAQYGTMLGIRSVVGVNMRWDLSFWHELRKRDIARNGTCVLRWSNRGVKMKHTVEQTHVEEFMAIGEGALQAMASITMPVLNVYVRVLALCHCFQGRRALCLFVLESASLLDSASLGNLLHK
eukprot:m.657039 g.657039  ORF g.657039 m.657039 type:complete len:271 (-) comp22709_c1_seq3:1038-1850(-)